MTNLFETSPYTAQKLIDDLFGGVAPHHSEIVASLTEAALRSAKHVIVCATSDDANIFSDVRWFGTDEEIASMKAGRIVLDPSGQTNQFRAELVPCLIYGACVGLSDPDEINRFGRGVGVETLEWPKFLFRIER